MYRVTPMTRQTFADLIATWPRDEGQTSIATFAGDIGVPYYHASTMRYRSSISVDRWPAVIAAAKRRGFVLTHESMAKMRERRRGAKPKHRQSSCLAAG